MNSKLNPDSSTKRKIFRLRSLQDRPNHSHDLATAAPADFSELTECEKISVAEFIEFLAWREKAGGDSAANRDHFYMRDHDNRPKTQNLKIGTDAPIGYAKLSKEDRFHVNEFIQFLLASR